MTEMRAPAAPDVPVNLGAGMSVVALTDATADHRKKLEETFPGTPAAGWPQIKRTYPETLDAAGHWRLPVTTFLIRTPDSRLLVDTGVGPAGTLASEVFRVVGDLPDRLAALELDADAVDAVVFTHSHEDHLGWACSPRTGRPTFTEARYLIAEQEWASAHQPGATPDRVSQSLDPLNRAGLLERIEYGPIAPGVDLVPLPGHTPGHSGVVVAGPLGTVALVGDAFNHPLQVGEPDVPSIADSDQAQASATRREIITRALDGGWPLLASAHLPGAFWSVEHDRAGVRWRSRAGDVRGGTPFRDPGRR